MVIIWGIIFGEVVYKIIYYCSGIDTWSDVTTVGACKLSGFISFTDILHCDCEFSDIHL